MLPSLHPGTPLGPSLYIEPHTALNGGPLAPKVEFSWQCVCVHVCTCVYTCAQVFIKWECASTNLYHG